MMKEHGKWGKAGLQACSATTWFSMAAGTVGGRRCTFAAATGFWLQSGERARFWGADTVAAPLPTLYQLWCGDHIPIPPCYCICYSWGLCDGSLGAASVGTVFLCTMRANTPTFRFIDLWVSGVLVCSALELIVVRLKKSN